MEKKKLSELTNAELLVEKEKLKKSKITHAVLIGFLAGILIFGIVGWSLSSEKQVGFLIPMLILVLFIYKLFKNSDKNKDLEAILKERNLH
ncbi:MAG: hypothetical protein AAF611_14495 [Bacteroidota bacterium]